MPATNILGQGVTELNAIKQQLIELNSCRNKNNEIEAEENGLEKAIGERKRSMETEILRTIKKRRDELSSSYDRQISNIQTQTKKTSSKKAKSKHSETAKRIKKETDNLVAENKQFLTETKTLFKQNHVPRFCNTKLFFSLFAPGNISDIGILLLFILAAFLILPCGIYFFMLKDPKIWMLILIYFIDVVLVGITYFSLHHATKEKYLKEISSARQTRKKIAANDKKIKAIKNSILKDQDESYYDLEEYNQELTKLNAKIAELAKDKTEALSVFEAATTQQITEEIKASYQKDLVSLQDNYNQAHEEGSQLRDSIKNISLSLSNQYETYLGREFLTEEKLNQLIQIIEQKQAATIGEALAIAKQSL